MSGNFSQENKVVISDRPRQKQVVLGSGFLGGRWRASRTVSSFLTWSLLGVYGSLCFALDALGVAPVRGCCMRSDGNDDDVVPLVQAVRGPIVDYPELCAEIRTVERFRHIPTH